VRGKSHIVFRRNDLIVNDRFADAARGTSVSEIVTYDQLTPPVAEEPSTTTTTTTTTTRWSTTTTRSTTTSRLTVLEAYGAARTLDKWVNRLGLLNVLDGIENDEDAPPTRISKLRAFVPETFGRTCRELRLSGTFAMLQRANDSMQKATVDGRELERETSNDSRDSKHKQPPPPPPNEVINDGVRMSFLFSSVRRIVNGRIRQCFTNLWVAIQYWVARYF